MKTAEYMKISYNIFPQDICDKYNLKQLVNADGYVYIKIKKGMYGLKQAAILAYKQLKTILHHMDMNRYLPPYHSGTTEQKRPNSAYAWMISE